MKSIVARSNDLNILLVGVLYYLSAEAGFFLAFEGTSVLPIWPPAGIALALIAIYGRKVWPGIAIGSLIVTIKSYWFGSVTSVQMLMLVSAVITGARILEPLAGEYLFKKLIKSTYPFTSALNAFYFAFISLSISTISPLLTASILVTVGSIPPGSLLNTIFALWASNVVGILVFAPLLLAMHHISMTEISIRKIGELSFFVLSFLGLVMLFKLEALRSVFPLALPFLVLPFLLWLAFRFDVIIAITGAIAVSLAAIYFTGVKLGPLAIPSVPADSILLLQVYVGVICVSTLVLASAVRERETAQLDLKKFSENLEAVVRERTHALEEEISNRKKAQQSLQDTNAELMKRNSELDSFAYSVSHDLRAPIASILGLINLARKDKSRNTLDMCLEMMEKSANQQDLFIKEILDQSRNSRIEVIREAVMFEPLIEEAFDQLDPHLMETPLKKIVSVKQTEPFYCDKWRLKLILNNIISNSIRYRNGRDPEIIVDARITNHRVNLIVQDNGRGIKKEHLLNLGKMFYRATDEGAGAGLGLYIVKETVEKLKGSMAFESVEGYGTTVKFEIPEVS